MSNLMINRLIIVWEKLVIADYSFDFKQAILFLWFEIRVVQNDFTTYTARQQSAVVKVVISVDCIANVLLRNRSLSLHVTFKI